MNISVIPEIKKRNISTSSSCVSSEGSPNRALNTPNIDWMKFQKASTPQSNSFSNARTASTCHRDKTVSINFKNAALKNVSGRCATRSFARNLTQEMTAAENYRSEGVSLQKEEECFEPEISSLKVSCLSGDELPPFNFNKLELDFEDILPLSNFVSERSYFVDSYSSDEFSPLGDSINPISSMY